MRSVYGDMVNDTLNAVLSYASFLQGVKDSTFEDSAESVREHTDELRKVLEGSLNVLNGLIRDFENGENW